MFPPVGMSPASPQEESRDGVGRRETETDKERGRNTERHTERGTESHREKGREEQRQRREQSGRAGRRHRRAQSTASPCLSRAQAQDDADTQ